LLGPTTSPAPDSDEQLVARLAAGQPEALGPLYERYARLVLHLAARSLDRPAAEEIVQDVFLEVWRTAAAFDAGRGSFRAWLLQPAHWRVLNELRRRSRRPRVGPGLDAGPSDDPPDPGPGLAELVDRSERRAALRAALDGLPASQRQALGLAFL